MVRIAFALACMAALTSPVRAAEPVKARLGILSGAAQSALVVAVKTGIFAKYGFEVDARPLVGGVQGSQALAADQVDWSAGGIEPTIIAAANGLPFKPYVMYAKGGDSYGVLVRKAAGINSPADLKGHRVAVAAGTATVQGLDKLLDSARLPHNAVQRVNASFTAMGQMLVQGAIDAMVGIEPYLTLTQEKMNGEGVMLARLGKFVQGGGFVFISDRWAAAHPDKLVDVVTAIWEAEQFVRQHPKEAAAIEAAFIKADPAIVEAAYRYLTFEPRLDAFTEASFASTAKFLLDEKLIPRGIDPQAVLAEVKRLGKAVEAKHADLLH